MLIIDVFVNLGDLGLYSTFRLKLSTSYFKGVLFFPYVWIVASFCVFSGGDVAETEIMNTNENLNY